MLRRALASVLLAVAVTGAAAAPASAHASLVSTDPAEGEVLAAPPDTVTLTFDEPVSLVAEGLLAYDAAGERVDVDAGAQGEVVTGDLPDGLAEGTYVVTWRVVSTDGHPIAGSLTFHVGAPSEQVVAPPEAGAGSGELRPVVSVVQGASYVALLVAGGLVFFLGWPVRGIRLHDDVRRRLARLLRLAAGAAIALAAVAVPLSGAYQQGLGIAGVLDGASYDLDLVGDDVTVLVLQVLGLAAALGTRPGRATETSGVADLGAALAVWSPAVVGHTRAYQPTSLLVVTDAIHLSAGAVWLGGLVGLAVTVRALAGRPRDLALLLARFSTLAATVLGTLAVTGVLLGWRILGSWQLLVETTYGRLLLVKVAIALLVAALAAWNRFGLLPRTGDRAGHDERRRVALLVRRSVAAEALLLVGLLGVTGFLVEQPPRAEAAGPRPAAGTGVVTAEAGDDLRVLAVLDPGTGLRRRLQVQVQDAAGEPVDLRGAPEVSLRSGEVDLGRVPVAPLAAGTYAATITFPTAGEWEVQVSLPVSEFDNPVTTLRLDVH